MSKLRASLLSCFCGNASQSEQPLAEPCGALPDPHPPELQHVYLSITAGPRHGHLQLSSQLQEDAETHCLLKLQREFGGLEGNWLARAHATLASIAHAVGATNGRLYGTLPPSTAATDKATDKSHPETTQPLPSFILLATTTTTATTSADPTTSKLNNPNVDASTTPAHHACRDNAVATSLGPSPSLAPWNEDPDVSWQQDAQDSWQPQLPGMEVRPAFWQGGTSEGAAAAAAGIAGRGGTSAGGPGDGGYLFEDQFQDQQQLQQLESLPVMLGRMLSAQAPVFCSAPARAAVGAAAAVISPPNPTTSHAAATASVTDKDEASAGVNTAAVTILIDGRAAQPPALNAANEASCLEEGHNDVVALVPLIMGKRVVGALWLARYGDAAATSIDKHGGGKGDRSINNKNEDKPAVVKGCSLARLDPCPSLLTSSAALQQIGLSVSLCLMGTADSPYISTLCGSLQQISSAASMQQLIGGLCDAVTAHVRQRFMLDPRVVAALVPDPHSSVGLLFSWGAADPAASAAATAAAAAALTSSRSQSRSAARDMTTTPATQFSSEGCRAGECMTDGNGGRGATAHARTTGPVAALLGEEVVHLLDRVKSETGIRGVRRAPVVGAATVAGGGGSSGAGRTFNGGGGSWHNERGEFPIARSCRNGSVSRVIALTNTATATASDSSVAAVAAAGAPVQCVALRAKPFPLPQTLLRHVIRKGSGGAAAGAVADSRGGGHTAYAGGATSAKATTACGSREPRSQKILTEVVEDCALHVQDPRLPSRDILMILANASMGVNGGFCGGGSTTASGSFGSVNPAAGRRACSASSLLLLVLPVVSGAGASAAVGGSGGVGVERSKGMLGLYVMFTQQLPAQLLHEARNLAADVLEVASPVVSWKVLQELSLELETLSTASPGSYAVVETPTPPLPPALLRSCDAASYLLPQAAHSSESPATSSTMHTHTFSQHPHLHPQLQCKPSLSRMPSLGLMTGLSIRPYEAGSNVAASRLATTGGGEDGAAGDRIVPVFSTLMRSMLMDSRAPGSSMATTNILDTGPGVECGGGGGMLMTTMLMSGRDSTVAASAMATGGGGGGGGGCNGGAGALHGSSYGVFGESGFTRSASLIMMEEMDPAHNTLRSQVPFLVASIQDKINSAKAAAAATAAAVAAAATSAAATATSTAVTPTSSIHSRMASGSPSAPALSPHLSHHLAHPSHSNQQQQAHSSSKQQQQLLLAPFLSDLASLELRYQLGHGGCAVVFKGSMGTMDCAIKLMEMPDIDDTIDLDCYLFGGSTLRPTSPSTAKAASARANTAPSAVPLPPPPPSPRAAADAAAGRAGAGADAASGSRRAEAEEDGDAVRQQLVARRALLRNAMELAVMSCISHPNIMQVYSSFSNVTLVRKMMPDGSQRFQLAPAQPGQEENPDAPPVCMALVCEWCDVGCLGTALQRRTFPVLVNVAQNSSNSPNPAAAGGRVFPTTQRVLDYKGMLMTLLDVALALRHLHSHLLIHRDVKPGNVLLRSNAMDPRGFSVKLADFGFATLLNQPGDEESGGEPFVIVEESCGTVTHMAPECWSKPCRLDASCDAYSFGILMWELTAGGTRPHPGIPAANIPRAVRRGARPVFDDSVPVQYRQLAQRCWSSDPLERPRAPELVALLSQLLTKM